MFISKKIVNLSSLRDVVEKIIRSLIISRIQGISINNVKMMDEELISSAETFKMPEKLDIFGQKHDYFSGYNCEIPAFFVRSIKRGKVVVGKEEIFTSDDQVILEYTSQKKNPCVASYKGKLKKVRKIKGSVANLSLSGLENNYYHWLTECLGRYYLLEQSKFKPDFYILSSKLPFQRKYIEILNIDRERILDIESNVVVQADELIIPSFINNWEPVSFRGHVGYQKQWLPSWIGNIYQGKIVMAGLKNVNPPKNKIYISRAFAEHRKIENEAELISLLRDNGYGIYHLENMSVEEQIKLFSTASIVLGAHGAGFSNIYFCPRSAIVCELFSEYYHDSSFKILSNALGLRYNYVIGRTTNLSSIIPKKENLCIDLQKLTQVLNILNSQLN